MKNNQRLEQERLAEALEERGLVEGAALRHVLHQCIQTGSLFTELLVTEGMITDWELGRVSSELFGLAFLSVESYEPSAEAHVGIDTEFLRQYCIVPLDRFGDVLTIALPGMVPTEVISTLAKQTGCRVLCVAGSVSANRIWLNEHMPRPAAPLPSQAAAEPEEEWGNIFDQGDQAVLMDLGGDLGEEVIEEVIEDSQPAAEPGSDLSDFDLG